MAEFNEIVAARGFHLKYDRDEVVWRTGDGYPDYRSYTAPHPGDPADRVHFISAYNLRWNTADAAWRKDVANKAGFHMVLESDWDGTIEWNLDHTLANNDIVHRALEVRIDVDTSYSYWRWYTSPATAVDFGYGDRARARWHGEVPGVTVRWEVQNTSPTGAAAYITLNADGKGGWIYASPAQAGGSTFGTIPASNLFAVFGKTQTAIGADAPAPLYFVTSSLVRGRVTEGGAWVLGPQPSTPQAGPGDLLLARGRYLHGVDAADGGHSHPVIGVDDQNRTSLGLGGAPLSVIGAVTVPAGARPVAGYISAVVNGAAALIPYHTP